MAKYVLNPKTKIAHQDHPYEVCNSDAIKGRRTVDTDWLVVAEMGYRPCKHCLKGKDQQNA